MMSFALFTPVSFSAEVLANRNRTLLMRALVVILLVWPSCVWADTLFFGAINRFEVAQVDADSFEVIASGGRVSARDYWCAAGDYGLSQGLRSNTRVYLSGREGPSVSAPGRKAVRFTFDPQAADVTPIAPQLSLSVSAVGDNMSLVAAQQFCGNTGILGF